MVTANKELVATHGYELLQLAKEHGVSYLFEASVGGGIPILRPLTSCLAANELTRSPAFSTAPPTISSPG